MIDSLYLQLFLLLNVFLIGVLSSVAVRHGFAHFKPAHHDAEKKHRPTPVVHLPPAVKEQLLSQAQRDYKAVLDHSALELQRELKTTAVQLNKQLAGLGTQVVEAEMKRYHASLETFREQTEALLSGAKTSVVSHHAELDAAFIKRKAELESKLTEEISAEKQRLIEQIDTRLADAVASFLDETLQHNVDLGAQGAYLTSLLEEHKADFKRGVSGEN